jgi:hypothetical protein
MPQVESDLEETCWRHELERAFAKTGDSWSDFESMTLSDDGLARRLLWGLIRAASSLIPSESSFNRCVRVRFCQKARSALPRP